MLTQIVLEEPDLGVSAGVPLPDAPRGHGRVGRQAVETATASTSEPGEGKTQ